MIQLQNITKIYSTRSGDVIALKDVNLHIAAGEIFGVIGKSGAGKSSLIRCVNLLERPTHGKVLFAGENLLQLEPKKLRQARHKMGMIFQHFNLLTTRTAFDNIALPLELLHVKKADINRRVHELLELVELQDKKDVYPAQLSGGQKQRVAIARALATAPSVLLCDEMTSALDPETTIAILNLIKNINEQFHLSILLITHEMDVIKRIADKVAVLDQGSIVETGSVVDIFKRPTHSVTRRFTQDALHMQLPTIIANAVSATPTSMAQDLLLRIRFVGKTTAKPVVDTLIRECQVVVNILQANIEYLRHETLGVMLITMKGSAENFARVRQYLQEHALLFEELGYVNTDAIIIT